MELEQALAKIKELETTNGELTQQVSTLSTEVSTLKDTVTEKDRVITEKNQQLVGIRKESQRIKELSEEEKQNLTAEQIAAHEANLKLQEQLDARDKELDEYRTREISGRKEAIFSKLSKGDQNLRDKIALNFDRIKGSEEALTEQEIEKIAGEALILSNPVAAPANPINNAINSGDHAGDPAPNEGEGGEDFAETEEGKQVASLLQI